MKRAESGSRFNVRYRNGIPSDALTPDGLMRALAPYMEFTGAAVAPGPIPTTLRKGLWLEDVESLLGPAVTASETKEGTLTVLKRAYRKGGQQIDASFVNGVLIDYTIRSQ